MRCGRCFIWILSLVLVFTSAPALAEVQSFRLIPDESQIITKIKDPFGSIVNGALRVRQGEARGDIDRLQEVGSVSLVIDTSSYNSNIGLRDQDVQEHYLEVQQYPVIRFNSTGIQNIKRPQSPEDLWQITVRGRLELHGVQKEVIVPVRLLYQTNKITAQGNFRFVLEDFNIRVPTLLFLKAGNQVDVEFRIVGERQP
ncbi:MAG TPA: YceI family protein [Candidatus Binatia bacterium]|nr:YceI family protein [Candidatus Binatia bacterium]